MRRIVLAVAAVVIVLPVALGTWLLHTESGARFAWRQVEGALGGRLSAADVSGTLLGEFTLEGLGFHDESTALDVATITLAVDLEFMPAAVRLRSGDIRGVKLDVGKTAGSGGDGVSLDAALEGLVLPIAVFVDGLAVRDIEIGGLTPQPQRIDSLSLSGGMSDRIDAVLLVEAPEGRAELAGTLGLRAPNDVEAELTIELEAPQRVAAELRVDGTIDSVDVEATGRAAIGGYPPLAVEVAGRASTERFDVDELALESDDVSLSARGELDWSAGLSTTGDIELRRLDPAGFVAGWPAERPVAGSLGFAYAPGHVRLSDVDLGVAGTDMRVYGDTTVDLTADAVDGEIGWRALAWPIGDDSAVAGSPEGDVRLSGNLDDWRVTGDVAIDAPGVDPGRFEIEARGTRADATIAVLGAGVFGGSVNGQGSLSWVGAREWSATISATGIRTDTFSPALPGYIGGRVEASGSVEPLRVAAVLEDVDGEVAGQPLHAEGQVSYDAGLVSATNLHLEHGGAEVTLNGSPLSETGLVFSGHVGDIGDYVADATGELHAGGRVGLEDGVPWLSLTAAADRVTVGELEIEGFRIEDLAPDTDTRSRLNAHADAISFQGHEILEPRLELNATEETQSLEVDVGYEGLRFGAHVEGALDSWQAPGEWAGELEDLEFAFEGHPPVGLQNAADVSISAVHVSIERLCLAEPGGAALCLAFQWRDGRRFDVSARLTDMPVQMVNALADTGFDFDQAVSGELEWHVAGDAEPTGGARLVASPGTITSAGRSDVAFATAEGTLAFRVVDGRLLSGVLDLPMPGTGVVSGSFDVHDLSSPMSSGIEGRVDVNLLDVGALAALTPLIDEASGSLSARVDVTGSFDAPAVTGQARFADGGLSYEPIGLVLSDMNVTGRLGGDGNIEIDGDFQSGDGRGRITSRRGGASTDGVDVAISGTNLKLIDVPDVVAFADVDLGLAYDDGTLTIDGRLAIPRARVTPTSLPAGLDVESPDVVIVAGELPDEEEEEDAPDTRILGSLEFSLGDAVEVDLGIANATVTGSTLFTWSGDPMPMANGRFDIQGQIQAFGQPLTVTDGRIRFPDVPADNPTLRLRAEREIYGNSQVKTAGVLVAGELARPTIEAYTIPMTTEERALTLLVTGNDFDLEQGVGAVDFGTYIAPRLYLSYGVGIFERDNVISARYDLKRGFGIRATSGQRESGVDVIYRLER